MRACRVAVLVFILVAAASAADLKVKVVDPQSAAVAGAQVTLFVSATEITMIRSDNVSTEGVVTTFSKIATTSAEGVATFSGLPSTPDHVQLLILAPGFAPYKEIDSGHPKELITIQLQVATASETVVVSATRTPVVGEAAGADVETLTSGELDTSQPFAANDAVRFLPGAIVNTAGQRGGLSSLFVRGGESRYNKVIVDGVTVNEPGGTFDFGTLRLTEANRVEFVRGAQSTLYGSDAMTSVVQVWTREGSTARPELRFGADGGNFGTANGYVSLAGTHGLFDYNVFGDQFNTSGFGVNNANSDSLEGANIGVALSDKVSVRVHLRHFNNHTGLPGEWNFNGVEFVPPIPVGAAQLNNLLGSTEIAVVAPSGWQHHFTAFDYLYRYNDYSPGGNVYNFPSHEADHINRVGFEYQGDYSERDTARFMSHTTFGYRVENENGYVGDVDFGQTHGQRLNNDLYVQQQLSWGRLTAIAGGRFVHNSAFGDTGVPRIALMLRALKGGDLLSGTRLRFSYATGFNEPRLEETFNGLPGPDPFNIPNPGLKPERVRAFEAGIQQNLWQNKYVINATYFNNLFHDQINYVISDLPPNFPGMYVNVNQAFAQGVDTELQAKVGPRLLASAAYTYTSSQYLDNPNPFDVVYNPGMPLLRRPKHSGTLRVNYVGTRWRAELNASYVGRRSDSDFVDTLIDHAPGYVRADLGGWYAVTRRITAYANVENALDRRYNEVVGYPALPVNFRAGFRFRVGGE